MTQPLPEFLRAQATLEDKYRLREGWVYLTGLQALVRLPLEQRLRDLAAGRNTAGYISGYRGSPLGRYDMELWQAAEILKEHHVVFRPGINEDLAATAVWGSQHVGLFPGARYDGVFAIWYGKGPGVDRSGDALKHGNYNGASRWGGVLAVAGDDHGAKSSTVPNFSDPSFIACGMPILYPSNTQEVLELGLHGIAMSRYSGCWTGFKAVTDVIESGGTVRVGPEAVNIVLPEYPQALPRGGLYARANDLGLPKEERLYHHKLPAALAYSRANALNRVVWDAPEARLGILSAGKSFQDTLQALQSLGIGPARARELGVRLGQVGLIWPLDPVFVESFARRLNALLVVEEKRPLLENQIKTILYDATLEARPRVIGKACGANEWSAPLSEWALPMVGELDPADIARAIAKALQSVHPGFEPAATLAAGASSQAPARLPSFCSGCPHSRSTRLPEGSRALAGIGCHGMATMLDPNTTSMSHMGGEGALWLGQQPFTEEPHVFANMGDGTYYHSGFLAIRQAVAARLPITFKLLKNGFVSMTGGQPIEGDLSVPQTIAELAAEGVKKIFLVSDEPEKFRGAALPADVPVRQRSELDAVQRECREYRGVSVIIYDQPCANERRRLRKRGKWNDPPKRTFIHAAVCEGCGDCGEKSGCMAIEPFETAFGRKRRINQSSCNKDFSCVEGFCPSFVTVHGGELKKPERPAAVAWHALPDPQLPALDRAWSVLVGGIGGTGVVTIGQIIGMAAHLDGLHCSTLDVTGLAQKYGAVLSHVRIAPHQEQLTSSRVCAAGADAMLGCDLMVSAGEEMLSKVRPGHTRAVVSTDVTPTSEFARNPDWDLDRAALMGRLEGALGDRLFTLEAIRFATALSGEAMAANPLMLGYAWQKGMIPLTLAAIHRAMELNGVQIESNKQSFHWGRVAAHDPDFVAKRAAAGAVISFMPRRKEDLKAMLERGVAFLTGYQNKAYAERYRHLVERVATAETALGCGASLAEAVARSYFKLLAAKDAFEVARLYTSPEFKSELEHTFQGDYKLHFHLGAWPFARTDPVTGRPTKAELGPWVMHAFRVLARLKGLRGTWLDPWRASAEAKLDRARVSEFERDIDVVLERMSPGNHALAVKIAGLPQRVRGFGYVKEAAARAVAIERAELFRQSEQVPTLQKTAA